MKIIAEGRSLAGQYKVTKDGPAKFTVWRRGEWSGQWVIIDQQYTRREALAVLDDELLHLEAN